MKALFDANGFVLNLSATPAAQFHPDVAAQFINLPAGAPGDVAPGWRFDGDWTSPAEPIPAATVPLPLTFNQFVTLALTAGGMTPSAYSTARANPALVVYFDMLMQAQGIERNDPMMAMGAAAFVSEGLLTQAGWDAMIASWPTA